MNKGLVKFSIFAKIRHLWENYIQSGLESRDCYHKSFSFRGNLLTESVNSVSRKKTIKVMGADFNQLYKKKCLTNILTYGHISATTSQINFKFLGVFFNICTIQKLIDIKIDLF